MSPAQEKGDGEQTGGERETVREELGGGCVLREDDVMAAGWKRQGEEAIGAVIAIGVEAAINHDAPGRIVAEVEDKQAGAGEREGE